VHPLATKKQDRQTVSNAFDKDPLHSFSLPAQGLDAGSGAPVAARQASLGTELKTAELPVTGESPIDRRPVS
jgi:hypothetical protein